MGAPYWLDTRAAGAGFPDPALALAEPNGLLAVGGDLTPVRLINAYRHGIFPWYSDGQPILWWSPDPRLVLYPHAVRVSRSLGKTLRQQRFEVSFDRDFGAVINGCAARYSTWITVGMRAAYLRLHALGRAHSVECWRDGRLVGGLYGVSIGRVFFGESMFSLERDASKVALVTLARTLERRGYALIDCQVESDHLCSLGAQNLAREHFLRLLAVHCAEAPAVGWEVSAGEVRA